MNYYDILLAKKLSGGGGGDITTEALNVTANGEYTAPTGKAYTPVNVNVPLPPNAYLLKELSNLPQPIASFSDGADAVMQSLKVDIEPVQSGSGDPSPENVRPISGWTEEVISVRGVNQWDEEWEVGAVDEHGNKVYATNRIRTKNFVPCIPNTNYFFANGTNSGGRINWYDENKQFISSVTETNVVKQSPSNAKYFLFSTNTEYGGSYNSDISVNYPSTITEYVAYNPNSTTTTIPFTDGQGQSHTSYGGQIDVIGGSLEDTKTELIVNDFSIYLGYNSAGCATLANTGLNPNVTSETIGEYQSNCLKAHVNSAVSYMENEFTVDSNGTLLFKIPGCSSVTDYQTWLSSHTLQIVAPMATSETYQQQPTSIKSLDGENNVLASTGDVEELKYFSK